MPSSQANLLLNYIRNVAGVENALNVPDRELLKRFTTQGDEAAFAALIRRHGSMVLRLCLRILPNQQDAEDVFQATFLVLSQKAASLRPRESLGSWLFTVSYRIAQKARINAARRRKHEGRAAPTPAANPLAQVTLWEAHKVLYQELARLQDKFRAPLVLCYLEGLTRDEAAHRLGWSPSRLKSRLEQARQRLRTRLAARGLTLSGALVASLFNEATASAAVPSVLLDSTIKTATAAAAGGAAALVVPAEVAALTDGILKTVFFSKLKLGAAPLMAFGILAATAGFCTYHRPLAPPPNDQAAIPANSPAVLTVRTNGVRPSVMRTDKLGETLPQGATERLGTLRFRHGGGTINRLILTPDGKTLISTSYYGDPNVKLWEFPNGKLLRQFPGHFAENRAVALTPDGKALAIGQDAVIHFYDLASGKEVRLIESPLGDLESLAFSADGKLMASGHLGQPFILWDFASGKQLARLPARHNRSNFVAFSPDGKTLATSDTLDRTIRLFDLALRKEHQLTRPSYVKTIAFSPNGATIAAGGQDGTIALWDVSSGKPAGVMRSPHKNVHAVAWSPDGKTLAASDYDLEAATACIRLWNMATGKAWRSIEVHRGLIESLAFSTDGKTLISGGHDSVIHLWDTTTGKEKTPTIGHETTVRWLALSRDGKLLAYPDLDFRLWDVAAGREGGTLTGFPGHAAFSPDGETIAGVDSRGKIRIWGVDGKRVIRMMENDAQQAPATRWPITRVAFSPDGKLLASAASEYRPNGPFNDAMIRLSDPLTGKVLRRLHLHDGRTDYCTAETVTFAPDGRTVAASGRAEPRAGKVRLWNSATGKQLAAVGAAINNSLGNLDGPEFPQADIVHPRIVYSPDGRLLAMNSGLSYVPIWEAVTGRERCRLEGHDGATACVAFAPDGRTLATAGYDQTIRLWDMETGKELRNLAGHRGKVNAIHFTPDGETLMSGGDDTTILFWDVAIVTRRGRLEAHLTPQKWEKLWADLVGSQAAGAHQAMARLTAARETVAALNERLQPASKLDSYRLQRVLRDLDSVEFAIRQQATREIEKLGEAAWPAVENALARADASPESRRRLEQLQGRLEVPTGELLRGLRAIEILERIATQEARQVLHKLADGAPEARLTREAKATLERLEKRLGP
jgi:RNA polymerase sigma factor (sigma-70 family)